MSNVYSKILKILNLFEELFFFDKKYAVLLGFGMFFNYVGR